MTWRTLTERDHCGWKLNEVDPCNRDVWRSSLRFAMHAASQLPGGEPTELMWMMLLHLHVKSKCQ